MLVRAHTHTEENYVLVVICGDNEIQGCQFTMDPELVTPLLELALVQYEITSIQR